MLTTEEIILRLLLSAFLGGLVGIERERLDWTAGLRTHMLVCIGATIVMLVSTYGFEDVLAKDGVVLDPARIAAQVVSGIGFLGAGTILFRRQAIHGLTTAAGLWAVAAIGLAVGSGMYVLGSSATLLMLTLLFLVKPFERRLFANRRPHTLNLTIDPALISISSIQMVVEKSGLELRSIRIKPDEIIKQAGMLEIELGSAHKDKFISLIDRLRDIAGINEIDSGRL